MVDMAIEPEEREEIVEKISSPPRYPYGLCISLCEDELEKLGLEDEDIQVGDMLHLHCLTKVTSVSSHESEFGNNCRVELTITHIAAESEDEENEEMDKSNTSRFYRK